MKAAARLVYRLAHLVLHPRLGRAPDCQKLSTVPNCHQDGLPADLKLVSFLDASTAQAFLRYARRNKLSLYGKRVS